MKIEDITKRNKCFVCDKYITGNSFLFGDNKFRCDKCFDKYIFTQLYLPASDFDVFKKYKIPIFSTGIS